MSDIFEFEDKAKVERLIGTLHDPAATPGDVLTVQPDKSIAAAPGGGGSGGVQTVTVPVSSAQILDLANTDVVLVAGMPGFVTVVQALTIAYLAGGTPYTPGAGTIYVATRSVSDPVGTQLAWNGGTAAAGFIDQADNQALIVGYPYLVELLFASAEYDGRDVGVGIYPASNPTLGDGTLLVTLSYFLAPTV